LNGAHKLLVYTDDVN